MCQDRPASCTQVTFILDGPPSYTQVTFLFGEFAEVFLFCILFSQNESRGFERTFFFLSVK